MWDCPSLQVYKPLYFFIVLHPIPYPQSIPSCDSNKKEYGKGIKCYEGLKPERYDDWSPLLRENDT